jgi:excisionase family DNA binding protein
MPCGQSTLDEPLLTAAQTAQFLGLDKETVRRWARNWLTGAPGVKLRGTKLGKRWRFRRSDVEALLKAEAPATDVALPERMVINRSIVEAGWRRGRAG